jgi:hypothetical protein
MAKPVKLSVHRNKIEAQRRKELKKEFRECAKAICGNPELAGYVIVGFDRNGNFESHWDTGKLFPRLYLPAMVQTHLTASVNAYVDAGERDDFEPRPRGVPWT